MVLPYLSRRPSLIICFFRSACKPVHLHEASSTSTRVQMTTAQVQFKVRSCAYGPNYNNKNRNVVILKPNCGRLRWLNCLSFVNIVSLLTYLLTKLFNGQDNLGKLVPKRQTILHFTTQHGNRNVAVVTIRTLKRANHLHLARQITTKYISILILTD